MSPSHALAAITVPETFASSRTSTLRIWSFPPLSLISMAVLLPSSLLLSKECDLGAYSASRIADARPMPVAPPVTMHLLSDRSAAFCDS